MASKQVRGMSKGDWQEIAKEYKVEFTDKNTVRYLAEKVAEKIGVDDKIVDLMELKQAVCDKLEANKKEAPKKEAPKKEAAKKTTPKKETAKKATKKKVVAKKKSTKGSGKKSETNPKAKKEAKKTAMTPEKAEELAKAHYVAEATKLGANFGATQTSKDIKAILDLFCKQNEGMSYTPYGNDKPLGKKDKLTAPSDKSSGKSRLQVLQEECTSYGVGFGEAHTEADLEQLLNAVKSAGATPIDNGGAKPLEQESFELDADNIDDIAKNSPNATTPVTEQAAQPIVGVPAVELPAHQQALFQPAPADVTKVDEGQLVVYRNVFVGTIKNHFRLMSRGEIADLFKQSSYPFTHVIKNHPEQGNKIEIILTSDGKSIRLPSDDKNQWIDING